MKADIPRYIISQLGLTRDPLEGARDRRIKHLYVSIGNESRTSQTDEGNVGHTERLVLRCYETG